MGTSVLVFAYTTVSIFSVQRGHKSFDNNMSNKEIGEKYGIHPRDVEKIKFAFEVYDFKGDGKVDAFYIGDLIRACNLNPTNNTIVNLCGGEKDKGKRNISMDDMYPIFKKAKGLMNELCDPEDDEGFTPFMPFLERMCKSDVKIYNTKRNSSVLMEGCACP